MREDGSGKNNQRIDLFIIMGIVLVFVILVVFVALSMQGSVTTIGNYPDIETNRVLNCKASGLLYPIFDYDKSDYETTEINVVFDGDKINSIALIQVMGYSNNRDAVGSEAVNHANMNKSFGADFGSDVLDARYSVSGNNFLMNLYANGSDLNERAKRYFLINESPDDWEGYISNYEEQGFECTIKE